MLGHGRGPMWTENGRYLRFCTPLHWVGKGKQANNEARSDNQDLFKLSADQLRMEYSIDISLSPPWIPKSMTLEKSPIGAMVYRVEWHLTGVTVYSLPTDPSTDCQTTQTRSVKLAFSSNPPPIIYSKIAIYMWYIVSVVLLWKTAIDKLTQ